MEGVTPNGKKKLVSFTILIVCVAILFIASRLNPDPAGLGTHQQMHLPKIAGVELHLPPCALYSLTGVPCATCGMTTAFAYGIHGRLRESFRAQPFGLVLLFLTVVLAIDSAVAMVTNRSLRHAVLPWKWMWTIGAVMLAAAWAYKIWAVKHPSSM